ncbi:hypothetical protein AMTR_s00104p00133950 [Amborella trichopoda]|uniref:Aminotransferase-like plant mobile domain-containing protein n=1 Tax=Amborella trichopoda TaxID=13333 RepID=W1NXK9_AMBTC|nr:hypothetical protein AMTR_s00104p00133950 [Amborella trichopoda]
MEHFKLLRPISKEIRAWQPRSLRWAPPRECDSTHNFDLAGLQELDNVQINDVIWTPYDDYPNIGEETAAGRDYELRICQIALCRTYLICGHICEGYMPDRPRDISYATQLLREGYNSRNWDLIGEALDMLKMYDSEVAGEEAFEELEFDDEMDDNVPV